MASNIQTEWKLASSPRAGAASSGWNDPYESILPQTSEGRIRAILGLKSDYALPRVCPATLQTYYAFLSSRLTLPFEARHCAENDSVVYPVAVVELLDPPQSADDAWAGLLCAVQFKNQRAVLPLLEIEAAPDSPNFAILEDYWYWLWNWRNVGLRRPR